ASFSFFNTTSATHTYTLSLHDALPISEKRAYRAPGEGGCRPPSAQPEPAESSARDRDRQLPENDACRNAFRHARGSPGCPLRESRGIIEKGTQGFNAENAGKSKIGRATRRERACKWE